MVSSLVPEKPIQISPSLAATIGLEEATMLSILNELADHREPLLHDGLLWLSLGENCVTKYMPFWTDFDIDRISKSLRDKGILHLGSAPFQSSRTLHFAFDERPVEPRPTSRPHNQLTPGISAIAPNWQPNDETLARIAQHNVPRDFVWEQIPEFVTYWRERGEKSPSWGSKFLQHILHKWRKHETFLGQKQQETAMSSQWRPGHYALDLLTRISKISPQFVEDAIPEFVLYWSERGDTSRTWNTLFTQHVRRQWARYTSALEHDNEPKLLTETWQPNDNVYDVLRLANIDLDFARQLVPEFVLYWCDSKQMHTSWNTKFLQHVKYHWAKRHSLMNTQTPANSQQKSLTPHARQQPHSQSGRTRDRSISEQLADRSWAY